MVKFIEINEAQIPVKFNFNVIRNFMHERGMEKISEFDAAVGTINPEPTLQDIEGKILLLRLAIKEGARIEKVDVTITDADLFAKLEDPEFLTRAMQAFNDSSVVRSGEVSAGGAKKKQMH